MPNRPAPLPSPLTLGLLAVVIVGGCTCFEEKRKGPLPTVAPVVESAPAPRTRYEPTPLDTPPPPAPIPVAPTPAPTLPVASAEVTPSPTEPPEESAPPPRLERLDGVSLKPHRAVDSLRAMSPGKRANLLRGPLVFPRKLQPLAPSKPAPDPDAPMPEPLPTE